MYPGPRPPGQTSPVSIGNGLHWKHVDEFTLLEAACLWAEIEPLNDFGDLHVSPEATASYQMLTRAIEDGRLVAYPQNPAPRAIKLSAEGQHAPDMSVSRGDLEELANLIGDKPLLLFPGPDVGPQGPTLKRSYNRVKLKEWYRKRVAEWPASDVPPSRDDDWQAAKSQGFPNVPREAVRQLKKDFAPPEWSKKGARPRRE
jgi:hypothetical protein